MMQLIDNWRQAWRMLSVIVSTFGAAMMAVWIALPDEQRDSIVSMLGPRAEAWIALALFVGAVVGRVIKQPALAPAPPKE